MGIRIGHLGKACALARGMQFAQVGVGSSTKESAARRCSPAGICLRSVVVGYIVVDHPIFKKRLSFTRAPDWVKCELCQRKGPNLPARFVVAVNDEENRPTLVESNTLVLLCVDCSALVDGAIDANEWRRRTNSRPAES
jgi:hypothetical protein